MVPELIDIQQFLLGSGRDVTFGCCWFDQFGLCLAALLFAWLDLDVEMIIDFLGVARCEHALAVFKVRHLDCVSVLAS